MTTEAAGGAVELQVYVDLICLTDRLPPDDLRPVLMGLYGEVGSVMAPVKKLHREKEAYTGYQSAAEEEFGDVLWYFAALARRLGHQLPDVLARAAKDYTKTVAASDTPAGPIVYVASAPALRELDDALLELGRAATELLILVSDRSRTDELLDAFARSYLQALQAARLTFSRVVNRKLRRRAGGFSNLIVRYCPCSILSLAKTRDCPAYSRYTSDSERAARVTFNGTASLLETH